MTKDHAPPFPPECQTEAEKKAFAFGWFKAMEAQRLAQPKQEPVARLYIEPDNPHLNVHYDDVDVSQFPHDEWFPVYKSPPQRTWVGLTDEEKNAMTWGNDIYRILELAEAKLKEKNT